MPRLVFPFRTSFYILSIRSGAILVVSGDGLVSTIRLAMVVFGVQMFDKEHYFINMDLRQSRIRYTVLFAMNILACIIFGVGISLGNTRPWPVLMVPWLVMFLSCTWLYYPNIIYHDKEFIWPVVICVLIMVLCIYCWCVVLSHLLDLLEEVSLAARRLRSDTTTTEAAK